MVSAPSLRPSKKQFLEAIAKIERFSAAPRVLSQATRLLQNPDSDLDDITKLIRSDSALTGDILRGANSAFYSLGEKVPSLERAIQKIGFGECMRLLKLSVAHSMSQRDLGCYGINSEVFWSDSLFNGILLETIARELQCTDPDTAHTTGLLRYVGRPAINQCLIDFGIGLFPDGKMSLKEWETENVGFNQTEAAGHLLRSWRFPEDICSAIQWQEDPAGAPSQDPLLLCLNFTLSILPEALDMQYAAVRAGIDDIRLPDSAFVNKHTIEVDTVKAWLTETRERFVEINGKLYGASKH